MLTAVHIYNGGDLLELPLDGSSGYVIKDIDGLGPVKADIVTTEYASMDGGVYQASKVGMRNIVLQLGFDPSYESEDPFGELRRNLYTCLTPKTQVTMLFLSNNFETVKITGYVESFEPSMFSAEPEVQVSIVCPDPYFNSLVPITVVHTGSGVLVITNPGTVETGLVFTIWPIYAPVNFSSGFTLTRTSPGADDSMTYIGPDFIANLHVAVQVVTVKGSKSVKWSTDSPDMYNPYPFEGQNALGYLDGWVEVMPGTNAFQVDLPPNAIGPIASVSFTPKYVGL